MGVKLLPMFGIGRWLRASGDPACQAHSNKEIH